MRGEDQYIFVLLLITSNLSKESNQMIDCTKSGNFCVYDISEIHLLTFMMTFEYWLIWESKMKYIYLKYFGNFSENHSIYPGLVHEMLSSHRNLKSCTSKYLMYFVHNVAIYFIFWTI